VRVAVDHLAGNGSGDVGEVEGLGLAGHLRMIDDLQQ